MKALSVRQPWAELLAAGLKTIEIRTWWPRVQLPMLVAIHASKTWDDNASIGLDALANMSGVHNRRGGIIGAVRLLERIDYGGWRQDRADPDNFLKGHAIWAQDALLHLNPLDSWAANKVGLCFDQPVRFPEIIPCRGKPGLFDLPEEVVKQIEALTT